MRNSNLPLSLRPRPMRRLIALVLMVTLVLIPLLGDTSPLMPRAHAQICGGASPSRIFQGCPLEDPGFEMSLEGAALDKLLDVHELPPEDRGRLMVWQRSEVAALIYPQLSNIAKNGPSGDAEKAGIAALAKYVKSKRVEAAQFAVDEYNKWKNNKCNYTPPTGFSYPGRQLCTANRINPVADVDPPKFEEFQAYGVARAYQKLQDLSAQEQMDNIVNSVSYFGGLAGGTIGGVLVGKFLIPEVVQKALFPYSLKAALDVGKAVGGASRAAAGLSKAVAFGGPILTVVSCIVTAVLRGIEVAEISQIPGKLQEKLDEQRNADPPDMAELLKTKTGEQEVFAAFTLMTLPGFPPTDAVPAAQDSDPKFRVRQEGASSDSVAATITFKSWDNDNQSARLNGGWIINKYKKDDVEKERWTLKIKYVNWRNELWMAGRSGATFTHVKLDDATQSFQSAEIKYLDDNGKKVTASMILPKLDIGLLPVVLTRTNIFGDEVTPTNRPIGIVSSEIQAPNTLGISVNNGSSATVGGVTISNLHIDSAGRVTADLVAGCSAASPATFNLRVTDSTQGKTVPLIVRLSPVADYTFDETGNVLSNTLPNGDVGTAYQGVLNPAQLIQTCNVGGIYGYNVTSGQLPPGLSFGLIAGGQICDTKNGVTTCTIYPDSRGLVGTPASGGTYEFTIKITFGNGDSFSRDYKVDIESSPVSLPDGAVSWWSGERGIIDDLNNNQGRLNNGFNSADFAAGKVGLAFSFNGSFGSVQLPDDFFQFAPSGNSPFTFETWFKTGSGGVIFGRQNTDPWGLLPIHYSPGIYVGNDGRLRVQMFRNGTRNLFGVIAANPVTSATAVNDNAFHHVAVIYDGTQQIVYLDGAEMGRATYTDAEAGANVSYKYQIGTGYALGWPSAVSASPWFGFKGLIDEPTMYNRALTLEEVKSIYGAGSAGKILVSTTNYNPTCAGASNGVVKINVVGGAPPFTYSFDGGATFQDSEVLDSGLSSGKISIAVKDIFGRTFSSSVTLTAPQPVSLSPALLPSPIGNPGEPFTKSFQASGGTGDKTLTLTGALPSGLTFSNDPANSAATIAGTPTQSGSFPVTITATDGNSCPTSQSYTLVVNGAPTITSAPTIARQQGAAGSVSTIGTVGDDLTDPGSLNVAVTNVPAGLTVTNVVNTNGTISANIAAACDATLGNKSIGLKVTDGGGLIATTNVSVNVTASSPPTITLKPSITFSPPNHKYYTVTIGQMVQSVTDDCNANLANSVVIEQVTSDEPDDAPGDADGITTKDIVIAPDCKSLQLHSERDNTKNGRVYAVTLRVTDSSGNITRAVFKVGVPLSESGGTLAVEDAIASTVNSNCR